ncbi:MAG TPA: ABC transporter permease [Dongiaceae bacterium]|nr:ABC transporter permease [Dongiaceae bacterium]
MSGVAHYFNYTLRRLRRSPGFVGVAVLTLAVGIGANTTMFSVMNAVLLRPLAIKQPSRVMLVQEQMRGSIGGVSAGNFSDVRRQNTSFSSFGASSDAGFNLSAHEVPERVEGEIVTASYFSTFGVDPIAGRVFSEEEDRPDQARVVVISERLWRRLFQANPTTLGQPVRVNGELYTVIGVMPKSFDPLLESSEVWVPAAFSAAQLANHDLHYLSVVGRLKPGVELADAQSELDLIARRLQLQYPMDDKEVSLYATPLSTALLGDQKPMLRMLLASVGLLLLIACANIANLQISRSHTRQKEIAVRAALGATSTRIVAELLMENVVLGAISGLVGVLFAYAGVAWIIAKGPVDVPRLAQTRVDAPALAFAVIVSLCSSIVFGLAPALRSASPHLLEAIKKGTGTSTGQRDKVQSVLVVGEIALALMLMTGAGLLIRSALLVLHQDAGFDVSNLIVGRIGLPEAGYHEPAIALRTFERISEAAATLPGVQAAAVVSRAPLAGGWTGNGLIAEGRPLDPTSRVMSLLQVVSPNYLLTAHVPLKQGRDFTAQDTRDRTLVALVSETLARTMWPGENPIGKRFACCEDGPKGRTDPVWHEVVGVVGDVRILGLDQETRPEFYLPLAQMPPSAWDWLGRTMDLVARTQGKALPVAQLRTTVASVAPGVPIYHVSTMRQEIAQGLQESHFDTFLLALFAGTALLLCSIGIYGVLSHIFGQRTRDIGVRMALGATPGDIASEVVGVGLRLIGLGIAIGLAGAWACAHLLSSLLYGIRPTDAVTFLAAAVILASVALVASFIPARRAMGVDPMVALRYE